jgi:protein-disulfide isomerase
VSGVFGVLSWSELSVNIRTKDKESRLLLNITMNKICLTILCLIIALATLVSAQEPVNPVLRPPKGAQVAIVVFEDLECPDCRRAAPLLDEAAKKYKIPLVTHDFPLPFHKWSFDAAVIARYFDAQSKQLGHEYRDYMFEHQPEITAENMRAFSEKFAAEHKTSLPFVVDPQGKLASEVTADRDLGKSIHLEHTPTIYVVSNRTQGKPFVEVVDRTQLFQLIDAMKAE